MKQLAFITAFVLAIALAKAKDTPCYNSDADVTQMKESCNACKGEPDVVMCVYKRLQLTDEDGNVLASKMRESYLKGMNKEKIEAVKEAMKDCGSTTEKMKDKKEIVAVWKCTDKALTQVCPEMNYYLEEMFKDPELKECFNDWS